MDKIYGYFMEPQNFSVNDGDGIRTTVFFAGCPLSCEWCANPEALVRADRISYITGSCIGCGKCMVNCPENIGINLNFPGEREKCTSCGICADVCPSGSRRKLVKRYSAEDILNILDRQEIFYRRSGGGVTFSGGEATMQHNILRVIANNLYDRAMNLAIETSGYFEFDEVYDILEKMDMIFVDIKHMDNEKHIKFTGKGNEKILNNIKKFGELNADIIVRIPLIEGVNADAENILKTAEFVKLCIKNPKIELLPYHSYGNEKYEALGLEKPSGEFKKPSEEWINELKEKIRGRGVRVVSYS